MNRDGITGIIRAGILDMNNSLGHMAFLFVSRSGYYNIICEVLSKSLMA